MYKNDLPACLPIITCRQYGRVEPQGLNGSYSADQRQVCRVANYQLIGQVRISIFRYFVNPLPKYPKVSKDSNTWELVPRRQWWSLSEERVTAGYSRNPKLAF